MTNTEYDPQLDEVQDLTEELPPPVRFVTGEAGTGKTYRAIQQVAADPGFGVLSAVTGIAAVNLGAVTLHSLLRLGPNSASARDWYLSGGLVRILHGLAREVRWLIIDEVSMLDGELLDILYRAVREVNRYRDVPPPGLGIMLLGDFAQLPPVRAKWAFEAGCWGQFEAATERLTTVYRQADRNFLGVLNDVRRGLGAQAASYLTHELGVTWHTALDTEFDGTTILPKNDAVSRYNLMGLDRVRSKEIVVTSDRWGKQRSEWGENPRTHEWGVPPRLTVKVGAYVMLLANQPNGEGGFEYVNGDCGHIEAVGEGGVWFGVKLVRTGELVRVDKIVRAVDTPDKPNGWDGTTISTKEDYGQYLPRPHYRQKQKRYVLGQVRYFPMRLAYASTVHKSQSLTLDRVQVDFRGHFFSSPAMLYVAMSRCRTLQGLRLVGQPDVFVKRCNVDLKVVGWL